MTDTFSLDLIEPGCYNSRIRYSSSNIERLAHSLDENGQLTPIRIRTSQNHPGKFEIIDGHRRFIAAKKLGWKMIRGELVDKNDEQTYCESLIENYEREDLSDYEKALFFERMNKEFRRTYEEIGRMVNLSKQQVGSYVAMLRLFSPSQIASNSGLADSIHQLSEHHARILSRVQDREAREDLTLMVVRRHLSVRELTNSVSHLKVWFPKESLEARSEQAVRQS
ncbi:MAG: ParB/RepB/Spo0J family partition protein, partial [Nitrososphaerota archaeon]|nr:ParB/RepB/Spo0J family partition protein [Nitrososphaerota archaeon]